MRALVGILAVLLAGCAVREVQHDAGAYCARQGGRAVIFDQHEQNNPVFSKASVAFHCVPSDQVLTLREDFGAEVASAPDHAGAIIVSVKGTGIAGRAGIEVADLIVGYDGVRIGSAPELAAALAATPRKKKVAVEIRHEGEPGRFEVQF